LARHVPVQLLYSLAKKLEKPPSDSSLTYSLHHLVLRDEPWILDLCNDHPEELVGGPWHLHRFKAFLRSVLLLPNCRRIIVHTQVARKAIETALGKDVAEKTDVTPWALDRRRSSEPHMTQAGRVKLLFVNSINVEGQFFHKGGLETLQAFQVLRTKYGSRVELTMRTDLSRDMKTSYRDLPGLKLIDTEIPWPALEAEYLSADIFVLPTHATPLSAFLEAMSFGLPVVTTDAWANPEIVKHGISGLCVRDPIVARYAQELLPFTFMPRPGSHEYAQIIAGDETLVRGLVESIEFLIENPTIRRAMGERGRAITERGEFSIQSRNQALESVLRKSLDGQLVKDRAD